MTDMTTVPVAVHHVVHALPHIKYVVTGVSYMTAMISAAVSLAIGFGLGWYVKGRGVTGVQNDLNNAKTVVAADVAKLNAPTPAATA
jgi:hypothetical protein